MKLLLLLGACIFSNAVFACLNISGDYLGTDGEKISFVQLKCNELSITNTDTTNVFKLDGETHLIYSNEVEIDSIRGMYTLSSWSMVDDKKLVLKTINKTETVDGVVHNFSVEQSIFTLDSAKNLNIEINNGSDTLFIVLKRID